MNKYLWILLYELLKDVYSNDTIWSVSWITVKANNRIKLLILEEHIYFKEILLNQYVVQLVVELTNIC